MNRKWIYLNDEVEKVSHIVNEDVRIYDIIEKQELEEKKDGEKEE